MITRSRLPLLIVIFLLLCPLSASSAFGQQTLGGLTGVVTDTQGGILPGVSVTLIGDQTGLTRNQVSGTNGFYDFANLPIGTYTVSFKRDGFETQKMTGDPHSKRPYSHAECAVEGGRGEHGRERRGRAADERGGYDERLRARQGTNPIDSIADGKLHRPRNSVAWRQCGVAGGHRRALRSGQCSHLGQRTTRHQQQLLAERRRRQQSIQRQEHQPGRLSARHQQHRRIYQHRRWRSHSDHRFRLPLDRQRHPDSGTRDDRGGSRQRLDVRRAAGLDLRRAHRHEHLFRDQRLSRQGLRDARDQLDQRRAVLLQERSDHQQQSQAGKPRTAPLHGWRHLWRPHYQEQALRLRLISAPAGLRSGDRRLFPRRAGRSLRYQPHRWRIRKHHQQ